MKSIVCLFVGLTLTLAGCTSHQVRYHTLVNPQPVAHPVSSSSFVIEMMPVGVPAQLDTQQVIIRQSDSSIAVLDDDRWLSPLGDELQTALSSRITQQFSTVDVAGMSPGCRQIAANWQCAFWCKSAVLIAGLAMPSA